MHAHGVEIFDRADDDAIVILIAHHLHFIFFPTQHRDLDEDFAGRRQVKATADNVVEFLAVVSDSTTAATHRKRWPDNDRKSNLRLSLPGFFEAVGNKCLGSLQANLGHGHAKLFSILGHIDGFARGANHFHAILFQYALAHQVERTIECGLTTHGG